MYTAWYLRHYLEYDKPRLNTLFHIDLDSHCREQIYQVRKIVCFFVFFFNIQTGIMNNAMFRDMETGEPREYAKESDITFTRCMALRLPLVLCSYVTVHNILLYTNVAVKSCSSPCPPLPRLNFGIS